jgi:UDP-N-acetylmuramoyl-tripeptide--D-alanyl-D-alanine ligase
MTELLLILLALVWFVGTCVRVYRQARFFQIEEYKNRRYLRWWLAQRDRFAPNRPLVAVFVGSALAIFLSEAPGSPLPGIIALSASLVALWPPDEGEIKKKFVRTQRATRLLAASFGVAAFDIVLYLFLASRLGVTVNEVQVVLVMACGLLAYLTVPLILASGNILMMPVEGFLRGRFVRSAKGVMADIRPSVVGITGSYGKTTTKNFLADILNGRFKAYATPKSYNTMMGVCIAINNDLANDYSVDHFIVEMGAYIRGEIARICQLTPPDISIVIEVGPQHLERFGSLENIAKAKYEIIKNLRPDGVGVFNYDNAYVREMFERGYPNTQLAVSRELDPNAAGALNVRFVATDIIETLDGLRFTVHDTETGASEPFETVVVGEHNVTNLLLATAVAVHQGMSLREVAFRVRALRPAESRLVRETTPQGITIINDAYSANPVGAVSALRVLGMHQTGRRVLVTPGMVELGDLHDRENQRLGEVAAQYATDVILVGEEQTRPIKTGLEVAGFPAEQLQVVNELREAIHWYENNLQPGDTVLFLNDLPDTY